MNGLIGKIVYMFGGAKRVLSGGMNLLRYLLRKPLYLKINKSTVIQHPYCVTPQYIECGERVFVGNNARIQGVSKYNGVTFSPRIVLEDDVSIQQNIHLTCANYIYIGKNTAIAANVTITDIHHPYEDIDTPIEKQNIEIGFVSIGEDSKIYNNAVILPNVTIGKHVTIGANSVVNLNIPDFCVAVGIPAKIVKRYCFETNTWRKTDSLGNFID